MLAAIKKGDSFQDKDYFNNHRCFVISDIGSENKHLAVNISSVYSDDGYDKACVIKEFKPYIYKVSFIYYRYAMELDSNIELDDKTEIISIPIKLLEQIQNGAKESRFFPRKFRKYFDLF